MSDDEGDEPWAEIAAPAVTEEEIDKIRTKREAAPHEKRRFEREKRRNWDLFYKRNETRFFKDRHWIIREFPLLGPLQDAEDGQGDESDARKPSETIRMLEIGCGVGNTVFPLLNVNPRLFIHACDFSANAIACVKAHKDFSEDRCHPFVCDLSQDALVDSIPEASLDYVTAFFVLSALSPSTLVPTLQNIARVVKPGGILFFRDYGIYDHAMHRFKPGSKITDQLYVRQDGTYAYFFSKEETESAFAEAGFRTDRLAYVARETVNRKEGLNAPRVFLQGQFERVAPSNDSA
eukprot:m.251786 g.251786  ORF g.251786 m.251786 type:complete len:292 (-) comp10978_c0_seq2:73-948(-)